MYPTRLPILYYMWLLLAGLLLFFCQSPHLHSGEITVPLIFLFVWMVFVPIIVIVFFFKRWVFFLTLSFFFLTAMVLLSLDIAVFLSPYAGFFVAVFVKHFYPDSNLAQSHDVE